MKKKRISTHLFSALSKHLQNPICSNPLGASLYLHREPPELSLLFSSRTDCNGLPNLTSSSSWKWKMYRIVVVYNKSFTFRSMLEKSFPKKAKTTKKSVKDVRHHSNRATRDAHAATRVGTPTLSWRPLGACFWQSSVRPSWGRGGPNRLHSLLVKLCFPLPSTLVTFVIKFFQNEYFQGSRSLVSLECRQDVITKIE